ncbi:hypothetical protein [Lignipirellula cremea]|uniref:Uncharacterized protein n=1 Tax=Lignipirellula cremea TaxID=2528010 RepID=A0A518DW28_9BACT|nr:hypothetical protein [Lignipirellula cremea]QDU96041.1 hypothetical protein Pla8534_38600 [Lignipirellula cremea]
MRTWVLLFLCWSGITSVGFAADETSSELVGKEVQAFPLTNLFVRMLHQMEISVEDFGASTGVVWELG